MRVGSWEFGGESWEVGVGRWELGVRRWEVGVESWELRVGRWELKLLLKLILPLNSVFLAHELAYKIICSTKKQHLLLSKFFSDDLCNFGTERIHIIPFSIANSCDFTHFYIYSTINLAIIAQIFKN